MRFLRIGAVLHSRQRRLPFSATTLILIILLVESMARAGEFVINHKFQDGRSALIRLNANPPDPSVYKVPPSRSYQADLAEIETLLQKVLLAYDTTVTRTEAIGGATITFGVTSTSPEVCDCGQLAVVQSTVPVGEIAIKRKEVAFVVRASSSDASESRISIALLGLQRLQFSFAPDIGNYDAPVTNLRCISTGAFEKQVHLEVQQALAKLRLDQEEDKRKRIAVEAEHKRLAEEAERKRAEEQKMLAEKAAKVDAQFAEIAALVEKKKDKDAIAKLDDVLKENPSPTKAELDAAKKYEEVILTLFKRITAKALADLSKKKPNPAVWVELFERYVVAPPYLEDWYRIVTAEEKAKSKEAPVPAGYTKPRFGAPKKAKYLVGSQLYLLLLSQTAEAIVAASKTPAKAAQQDYTIEPISAFWERLATWFPEAKAIYTEGLEAEQKNLDKMKQKARDATARKLQPEFSSKTSRCVNLINSLMALGKRAQGCRYGGCSAQTLGKMQDDSDRMNEQLNDTVNRLDEILGEESISEDKAEQMRKQARRSGCMRL